MFLKLDDFRGNFDGSFESGFWKIGVYGLKVLLLEENVEKYGVIFMKNFEDGVIEPILGAEKKKMAQR